jgi:poly-gamma-glutamate capsule biosynthesis protein CapA/YwtB (metallophosphatase superfamily)
MDLPAFDVRRIPRRLDVPRGVGTIGDAVAGPLLCRRSETKLVRILRFAVPATILAAAALLPMAAAAVPIGAPIGSGRARIIEDFDDGDVFLISYPGEDDDSTAWCLDTTNTYNGSPYSLKLYGDTWKIEPIAPETLALGDVWQVAAYTDTMPEIHGFGLADSAHKLLYAFAGTQQLNIEDWMTVYQGAFPETTWNLYQLPVGHDWLARFGYLPIVTGLVFVDDKDFGDPGVVYFDEIADITEDLPIPPEVAISCSVGTVYVTARGDRNVDVQFYGEVTDPDSYEHDFFWDFGDDSTSTEQNPFHTFLVLDDHVYTVLLQVVDDTDLWDWAVCHVDVDSGPTTFPVTMNFTGDLMLGRRYIELIDSIGVDSIFKPTLPVLGEAADITVANLECPFTDHTEEHPTKSYCFKGKPEYVPSLANAGIDVVSLANNHCMDYLYPGLQETQGLLDSNGIVASGAGVNAYEAYLPAFYSKSGLTVAFVANSDRTGQYANAQPYLNAGYNKPGFADLTYYNLALQIGAVSGCSDLIVVESHAGAEYSTVPAFEYGDAVTLHPYGDEGYSPDLVVPRDEDRALRQFAIDEGADAVICHHPHIVQGLEVYNGKLIAHSLGNFAFDQEFPETFPSMILNAKINEAGFYEYSVTPIYIDDYIPRRATGELGRYILDYLARRSKELDTYLYVDRQSVAGAVILDTLSMDMNSLVYVRSLPTVEESGVWVSAPLRLERWGNLSSIDSIAPDRTWEYRLGREIIWFGNFEDEGSTLWDLNSQYELYDSTASYRGTRSVTHRLPPLPFNIATKLEERIRRYDEVSFTLHGYIKTQGGVNVTLRVAFYQGRDGPILGYDGIEEDVNGDSDWTFYHREVSVPLATHYFDVYPRSSPPLAGEAVSWFDDVGLIGWTAWQPFSAPTSVANPNDFCYAQVRAGTEVDSAEVVLVETAYGEIVYPAIAVDPGSLSVALPVGGIDTCHANISNNGTAELSFAVSADASWIAPSPTSGWVDPGSGVPMAVGIDATELAEGSYSGSVAIQSNDPCQATVTIPVDLTVTPEGMVTDLIIRTQADSVVLSWSPVPNVLHYNVYRSDDLSGPWQLLASQDSTTYVDESALQLCDRAYYQIRSELPSQAPARRHVSPVKN